MARIEASIARKLRLVHRELDACRACANMVGPVVHGPPVVSRIYLLGQAPGPHEGNLQRPFAWTAGRTLFGWFESALGWTEDEVRERVYFAAVARCFPGKAPGGGDRRPDKGEIDACRGFIAAEVAALRPSLVIPVGTLAIGEVLGRKAPLAEVVGTVYRMRFHGSEADVIPLPHPSGASPWHKLEPGRSLLRRALSRIAEHETVRGSSPPAISKAARRRAPAQGSRSTP